MRAVKKWLQENNFFIRKLHSLSGVVPLRAFFIYLLITNSFAKFGPEVYNQKIEWFQSLPYLYALEYGFIFIPILFHALLGFVFLWAWSDNSARYPYGRNWMYTLQRASGMIVFVFIAYHVWEFRFETQLTGAPVNFDLVANSLSNPLIFYFYVLGITLTVFHFANGLWGFCVHWGITVGPRAQKLSGFLFLALGLVLVYIGLDALWAFR